MSADGTSYITEFELTGRGFSKMSIRRSKIIHGVLSMMLCHDVDAPTSAKLSRSVTKLGGSDRVKVSVR